MPWRRVRTRLSAIFLRHFFRSGSSPQQQPLRPQNFPHLHRSTTRLWRTGQRDETDPLPGGRQAGPSGRRDRRLPTGSTNEPAGQQGFGDRRRAPASMSCWSPSVWSGDGDDPTELSFFSDPAGIVTQPARRVSPPRGSSFSKSSRGSRRNRVRDFYALSRPPRKGFSGLSHSYTEKAPSSTGIPSSAQSSAVSCGFIPAVYGPGDPSRTRSRRRSRAAGGRCRGVRPAAGRRAARRG
jgi:hypothetical protein